ncbi:hypothetical protein Bbelb_028780 [Branchiostoma belcheri]|nr:hypothetical protein Bbelb_028780 [Branchiostoma belcheri]
MNSAQSKKLDDTVDISPVEGTFEVNSPQLMPGGAKSTFSLTVEQNFRENSAGWQGKQMCGVAGSACPIILTGNARLTTDPIFNISFYLSHDALWSADDLDIEYDLGDLPAALSGDVTASEPELVLDGTDLGQPPAFYGLPKIHKQSVPLRPIVSSIGSVTYELAGFLAKILGPLVGKSQHHVQNSADFVNKIKDIHVEDDETITSYDVCSLFTSIPPKEAVSVVKEALEADDTLADRTNLSVDQVCELLELCLGCTYFTYKGQFYQQMHGCAMGSPVSPIVVNLYMEKFENKALSTFNDTPPANWFRYVDDTWCRLKKRVAPDFFDHINQIDDNIKFTQEPSHDNMLPFLDTKTIVEEDGNLRFEVYRKPTHTDQYLAFDSHHPLEHKLAVIKTLFHRADNIVTSDQAKTDEHRHLRGALAKCGYQNWTFNKALKPSDQSKKTQKCKPLTNKNKANITIPYVQGVSEKLRRIFQNFNIATNFKPHSTLRQRLVHPKDRPHKGTKANVIYRLKCEEPNCNNTYIGETSRPLKVRYKEHCRPSANGYSSAIFHHLQHNQGHSFKLESTDVLDRETRWWERGVKEAIYERMYNPTLNREGGLRVDLSGTWDLALPAPRTDNT